MFQMFASIVMTVMLKVHINGHHVDGLGLLDSECLVDWFISPKVGWFVHIEPYAGKWNLLIQSVQLSFPKIGSIWMQIINEMNSTRPDLSNIIIFRMTNILQEHIQLPTQLNTFMIQQRNTNINQRNPMKIFLNQKFLKLLRWIIRLINCKNGLLIHIIEVIPHRIDWNVMVSIVFNDIFEGSKPFITPSTLMPSERPKWWDVNSSNKVMILLESFLWVFVANENNEMNIAAQ